MLVSAPAPGPRKRCPDRNRVCRGPFAGGRLGVSKQTFNGAAVIDKDGFRPNVGIILANAQGQVLWARRVGGRNAWQFPQGGIHANESPEQAMYRELWEEVGLTPDAVTVVSCTRGWLRYRLPRRMLRHNSTPKFVGQKQKWFLLRMLAADDAVCVAASGKPEFDFWRWVSYWYPLGQVVAFKRDVYRRAMLELAPSLPVDSERSRHQYNSSA